MDPLDVGVTLRSFSPQQKVFNRFILQRILGRGGMGVVWLAKDTELDRAVALKFLPEIVALDSVSVAELKKETRRNLDLTHPHIVRIYDFVQDARSAAISMEFVDGPSLSALRAERPAGIFPLPELRILLGQLADGLGYAHERAKVVHRDLKPANLMLTAAGELKITDFGIATSISDSVSRISGRSTSGTAAYMSPQQMMGERAAPTDDIYAVGATLYELLTGKPPFHTGNILAQVTNKVPPSIAERRAELGQAQLEPLPASWESAIARCLAKDPHARPQSMRELLAQIEGQTRAPDRPASATAQPASVAPAPIGNAPSSIAPDVPSTVRQSRLPLAAGLAAVAILVAGTAAFLLRPQKSVLLEQKNATTPVAESSPDTPRKEPPPAEAAAEPTRPESKLGSAEPGREPPAAQESSAMPIVTTGSLLVSSEPDDAEVTWGTITRRTPTQFQNVPAGRVTLLFTKTGHTPARLEVELKAGENLTVPTVRLAPVTYPVRLEATTADVSFALESTPGGTRRPLPFSVELPAGRHIVRFFRPGYGEKNEALQVTAQGLTATADLRGADLRIESVPAGASVLVDGRERGRTPLVLTDLPPGPRRIELRLAGHLPKSFGFDAALGASDSRTVELEMDPQIAYLQALQGHWAAGLNGLRFTDTSGDATYRAGANFVKGRNFPMKLTRFDAATQTGVFRPDDPKLPTFEIVLRGGVAVLRWPANDRGKYYDVPMSRCTEEYFNKL